MNEIREGNICPVCGKEQPGSFPAHHLQPGTVLQGKYLIGAALGEGGFGITYVGMNINLGLKVAIKEYFPNGYVNRATAISTTLTCISNESGRATFEKGKKRFLEEARILAKFSEEEGVVSVYDLFEENNTAYIVMEYLDGITLKTYLEEKKRLSPEETMKLLGPVINTLGRIHNAGLIHRDISPDNIMILTDGKVKLLDFGAARGINNELSLSVVLKHGFAPEEQYRRKGLQGPWTDVYALCATIYKCIIGVTPDEASERIVCDHLLRPSAYGIKVDPVFESALMKGLSIFGKDRYQSVDALMNGLNGKDDSLAVVYPETAPTDAISAAVKADPGKVEYNEVVFDNDVTVYGGGADVKETSVDPDKTVYSEDPYFRPSNSEETPTYTGTHSTEPDKENKKSKKGTIIAIVSAVAVTAIAIVLLAVFGVFKTPDTKPHTSEESAQSSSMPDVSNNEASVPAAVSEEKSITDITVSEPSVSEESAPEESAAEGSVPETSVQEESAPEPSTPEESIPEESSAEAHVHSFGAWKVVKKATCTEDGTKERVCSCGEKQTETIPATGHSFGEWKVVKNATCTENGTKERVCSCGEKQTDVIQATGHSYGNWVVTKPATDAENGVETKTCSVCGDKVTRSIDMVTHNYVAVVTKPTCTEQGYTTYTCSDCGKSYVDDYTKPLGHDWGAPTYSWNSDMSKVTATCTCSHDSSHKQTETVNTTSSVTKAATCEGAGTKTYTAAFTNSIFAKQTKTETIAALGHSWGTPTYSWNSDLSKVTATCTCSHDNSHKQTETVNTTSSVTKAATCEGTGTKTFTATFTNSIFAKQTKTETIAALGHSWGTPTYSWNSDLSKVTATCTCSRDGSHKLTETVYTTNTVTQDPTCESSGTITYIATFSNSEFATKTKAETIPALDHDYVNGVCTRCGATNGNNPIEIEGVLGFISITSDKGTYGIGDYITLTFNISKKSIKSMGILITELKGLEFVSGKWIKDAFTFAGDDDDIEPALMQNMKWNSYNDIIDAAALTYAGEIGAQVIKGNIFVLKLKVTSAKYSLAIKPAYSGNDDVVYSEIVSVLP